MLRTLPVLAAGKKMIVGFDGEGKIRSLKVVREEAGS
jgi:hypothetical protein